RKIGDQSIECDMPFIPQITDIVKYDRLKEKAKFETAARNNPVIIILKGESLSPKIPQSSWQEP
ncbi:MAG TPA: hypothetical protein VFD25_02675, partial [Clostridia bacterium]|nr:hypothetical protein [Clostridia bacterium]